MRAHESLSALKMRKRTQNQKKQKRRTRKLKYDRLSSFLCFQSNPYPYPYPTTAMITKAENRVQNLKEDSCRG